MPTQKKTTFPLQILTTFKGKNSKILVLCGIWPPGILGLPEVKTISRPQDLNLILVLKIRNRPRFRIDVV